MAANIKAAGYDGIIITGTASSPVCLTIDEGRLSFEDARNIWGRDIFETQNYIQSISGKDSEALCIGPAGEKLVRFATAAGSNGSCISHGIGAVMGSKNLKAIVARGTKKVGVASPKKLQVLNKRIRSLIRGRELFDPMLEGIELLKRSPCKGCPSGCARSDFQHTSGVIDHRKVCGSAMFHLAFEHDSTDQKIEGTAFLVTTICNQLGLCTGECWKLLSWMKACHCQGLLNDRDIGLSLDKIGSLDFFKSFAQKVILREGFGSILAEGAIRAASVIGKETEALLEKITTGAGNAPEEYNPRLVLTGAAIHATETTNVVSQLHSICWPPLFQWTMWYSSDGTYSKLSTEVLMKIAQLFWKSETAADFSTYDGKALAAATIQNREYANETLVTCDFFYPLAYAEGAPDFVGDPSLEFLLLSAVTGQDYDEDRYLRVGERVFNLTRAIQSCEGREGRSFDVLPEFNFTEPLDESAGGIISLFNPENMLPGPGGQLISRKGAVVERQKFASLMDEYYALRRWDVDSGLLTVEGLERLGLEDIIPILRSRKLICGF
jgi:aldehyde:ferredoxin oxidoreductase